jgi:hypothetical protein
VTSTLSASQDFQYCRSRARSTIATARMAVPPRHLLLAVSRIATDRQGSQPPRETRDSTTAARVAPRVPGL